MPRRYGLGRVVLGRNMLSMSALSLYRNAVQFGLNIVIAALLPPAAFGLVVFTTPFLVLLGMLADLGLASAIARAPSLSRAQAGAALGVTTLGGIAAAILLAVAAAPVADAVEMVGLGAVMAGMAPVVAFSLAAATPRALLERELRYGRIASIEAAAVAIGAVAAVIAAFAGWGVWALVLYNLLTQGLRAAGFGWSSRAALSPNLRVSLIKPLLSFGGWVLLTNLLNFAARNADNILIGASLGAAALGVYGLSYQFMLAPLMAITWPTSGILLATLRDEDPHGARAQTMVRGVIAATALVTIPAMLYLTFGLAWPVGALLNAGWRDVPVIVAWLAPLGALQSIASYNGALLMAAGRARAQFALTVVNTVVLLAVFVLALPFGLLALVKAYVAVSVVLALAYLLMIVRLTGLHWRSLARALAPGLAATAVGVAAVGLLTGFGIDSWMKWGLATTGYGAGVLATYAILRAHVRDALRALGGRVPAG